MVGRMSPGTARPPSTLTHKKALREYFVTQSGLRACVINQPIISAFCLVEPPAPSGLHARRLTSTYYDGDLVLGTHANLAEHYDCRRSEFTPTHKPSASLGQHRQLVTRMAGGWFLIGFSIEHRRQLSMDHMWSGHNKPWSCYPVDYLWLKVSQLE